MFLVKAIFCEDNGMNSAEHLEILQMWLMTVNCFFFFFLLFRDTPMIYGSSWAKGQIGTTAADLYHSQSNAGSLTHWARPGVEPASSWILVRFLTTVTMGTPCKLILSLELTQLNWVGGGDYRQLHLLNIKEAAGNIFMHIP